MEAGHGACGARFWGLGDRNAWRRLERAFLEMNRIRRGIMGDDAVAVRRAFNGGPGALGVRVHRVQRDVMEQIVRGALDHLCIRWHRREGQQQEQAQGDAVAHEATTVRQRLKGMPKSAGLSMELRILSQSKNELEVEVLGENETLLNPVKQALLGDKDVEFAEYIIEHPMLSVPKIFLRTKGNTKPETVLKRTIKSVVAEYDAFETAFVAALKKN